MVKTWRNWKIEVTIDAKENGIGSKVIMVVEL
jgi:hypothetical protein